jgi:hypothetical protein
MCGRRVVPHLPLSIRLLSAPPLALRLTGARLRNSSRGLRLRIIPPMPLRLRLMATWRPPSSLFGASALLSPPSVIVACLCSVPYPLLSSLCLPFLLLTCVMLPCMLPGRCSLTSFAAAIRRLLSRLLVITSIGTPLCVVVRCPRLRLLAPAQPCRSHALRFASGWSRARFWRLPPC